MLGRSQKKIRRRSTPSIICEPWCDSKIIWEWTIKDLCTRCNPAFSIQTVKTLSNRMTEKFTIAISRIHEASREAEHIVLTFDWWYTYRNTSVLGFMQSYLDKNLELVTVTKGNFRMLRGQSASDVCYVISKVVRDRLGNRTVKYFVSSSPPVNKAAVREFNDTPVEEHWFPWSMHFLCVLTLLIVWFVKLAFVIPTES